MSNTDNTTTPILDKNPIFDFIDGQRDCKLGKPADQQRGEMYQRGYAFEYQLEQMTTGAPA